MQYFKTSILIFIALAVSRFVPHPPNFTSLLALSFYVPALIGLRYIPALIISYVITDIVLGFHSVTPFTWGSVIFIGLLAKYFINNTLSRLTVAILGACIFFIITNFGVWSLGSYGYTIDGLLLCYVLALPFFGYSLISTLIFSVAIESLIKLNLLRFKKLNNNFY